MRAIEAELLFGTQLYREVIQRRLAEARETVWIATANVKEMYVERRGVYRSILELFGELSSRGVALRILHAEVPSRPFRAAFDAKKKLVAGGLELKICPRVHFKAVLVDGCWLYLGSANLTGAGLGARDEHRRNFEVGFVTEDFDTIDRTAALYEAVWSGAECRACKLYDLCPDPIGPGPPPRRTKATTTGIVELGKSRGIGRVGR